MRLLEYRLNRRHGPVVDRVAKVMNPAVRMIGRRERRGLGNVELVVTTTDGIPDLICAAHERLFGTSNWEAWAGDGRYGAATINTTGSLVIINAEALHSNRVEIDKTVLHELTHAAQFNRPGAWESAQKAIAHNCYGLGWMTDSEMRAFARRVQRDEREAAVAERLHKQLAQAVT